MATELTAAYWEQNPDALLVLSPQGVVLEWNPAAELMFGYSQAEVQGRSMFDLIVPQGRAHEEDLFRTEALRLGTSVQEAVRRRKDGSLVHVNVSTKAVCDADGQVLYFLSSKKDVTQLKVQRDAKLLEIGAGTTEIDSARSAKGFRIAEGSLLASMPITRCTGGWLSRWRAMASR